MVVLVWHTDSNTLTLIKEFAPGREEVSYGVVAGMYEKNKHDSPLQAAKYEVSEAVTRSTKAACNVACLELPHMTLTQASSPRSPPPCPTLTTVSHDYMHTVLFIFPLRSSRKKPTCREGLGMLSAMTLIRPSTPISTVTTSFTAGWSSTLT